jgi:Tfp pilus assembly protein PilF
MMRITFVTIFSLGLAVAAQAAPVGDDVLNPISVRMADAGRAALAKGDASAAIDSFEAALASDPKNVGAFTGIAQSYQMLGLPGKAVKYYREALALNPSDLAALEGQGKAYVSRGATARAQVNLARIKALCKTDCAAATRLEAALNAPVVATATPAKVVATNN